MENTNKKQANTMLYYVIVLCIAAIITVTLFTASKKEEPTTNQDVITSSQITSQSEQITKQTVLKPDTEKSTTSDNTKSSETSKKNNQAETKAHESAKTDVVPERVIYQSPVNGYVGKEYSIDVPVYSITMNDYRAHTGIDFVCDEGVPVSACAGGVVRNVINHPMMGTTVVIEHTDGVASHYMNLNESIPDDITVGAKVSKGQLLGAVGSTAITEIAQEPHLHFEMTVAGAYIDPMTMLDTSTISVMSDNVIE